MAVTVQNISVHGREGYTALVKRVIGEVQDDLSDATWYIEIPAIDLRKQLTVDTDDTKALRITITREEVELLPENPTQFAVIDESGELPNVVDEGTIVRRGYKGEPNG